MNMNEYRVRLEVVDGARSTGTYHTLKIPAKDPLTAVLIAENIGNASVGNIDGTVYTHAVSVKRLPAIRIRKAVPAMNPLRPAWCAA